MQLILKKVPDPYNCEIKFNINLYFDTQYGRTPPVRGVIVQADSFFHPNVNPLTMEIKFPLLFEPVLTNPPITGEN